MEWPRGVNCVGGDPLCTLHRAEGLNSWVTRKLYIICEIPNTKVNQVLTPATLAGLCTGEGPSRYTYSMGWTMP